MLDSLKIIKSTFEEVEKPVQHNQFQVSLYSPTRGKTTDKHNIGVTWSRFKRLEVASQFALINKRSQKTYSSDPATQWLLKIIFVFS